ncbi:MFS transporter [Actinomyces sp. MRS3W]|uniref:MFS transporter n=1 Tax=Actinomyces sp. MRS3W TaxID=2800796 RepID=UPI0028FD017E|nr:MFS transporter [Actinomyces sp. MRS3W]MDU0348928.1 MFS transporter [Actinomyces sp. MRS3W]
MAATSATDPALEVEGASPPQRTPAHDPDYVPMGKKLGWSARALSMAANVIIMGYFSLYATDTLGLNPSLVGTLLLASKVFDGVTDLLAGYLIDRTRTRWGRARPYEFAMIGLWVSIWALFSTPASMSDGAKAVWLFLLYTMVNSVFATLAQSNQALYTALAFPTRRAIGAVSAFAGLFISIGAVIVSMLIPQGLEWAGKDPGRWSMFILCLAIPMGVLGMMRFLTVKETQPSADDAKDKVTFREIFTALKGNPWIWLLGAITVLQNLLLNVGAAAYYFRYVVGNLGLQSLTVGVSLLAVPVVMVIPPLMKRFKLTSIMLVGQLVNVVGGAVMYFAGVNIPLLVVANLIVAVGTLPLSYMIGILVIDCATYNEWKGHRRLESIMGAVQSFAAKLGQGIGMALAGAFLAFFGYDGTLDAQPDSAIFAIRALFTWIPAVIALLMALALRAYRLEDQLPQINEELAARRAAQTDGVDHHNHEDAEENAPAISAEENRA